MKKALQVHARTERPVELVRLRVGHDAEEALYALQAWYADKLDRPVSRSLIARRALLALLEATRNMTPEEAAEEAQTLLRLARIA